MSLRVINDDCCLVNGKLVVVVEGDNVEQVNGSTANMLAIEKAATLGYQHVGINGSSGAYPVDSEGNTYEDENEQARQGLINAYRRDIFLLGGI
jgi:hypothetical protein